MSETRRRVLPVIYMTAVAVVELYDVLLLWPATQWFKAHVFGDFGDTLPAPTQFMVDAQWFLLLAVVITHGGAALVAHRRFGAVACMAALLLSVVLTGSWVWAMHQPFFSLAGSIK